MNPSTFISFRLANKSTNNRSCGTLGEKPRPTPQLKKLIIEVCVNDNAYG